MFIALAQKITSCKDGVVAKEQPTHLSGFCFLGLWKPLLPSWGYQQEVGRLQGGNWVSGGKRLNSEEGGGTAPVYCCSCQPYPRHHPWPGWVNWLPSPAFWHSHRSLAMPTKNRDTPKSQGADNPTLPPPQPLFSKSCLPDFFFCNSPTPFYRFLILNVSLYITGIVSVFLIGSRQL